MKELQTIILIFSFIPLFSQKETILNNPDIIWAAEVETDFIVDNYKHADVSNSNLISTIKLLENNPQLSDFEDNFLSKILLDNVFSNKSKFYAEKHLKVPLDTFSLIHIDTIINCFPSPGEKLLYIIHNRIDQSEISEYRLRQIVFYDVKKAKWAITALSVCAVKNVTDELGGFLFKEPIFWFNVFNEKPELTSNDIIWAKRLTTLKNSIHLDSVKVLKGKNINPMIDFIGALKNKSRMCFYPGEDFSNKRKLSIYDRAKITSWVDTLIEIKNEEVIGKSIVNRELNVTKIRKLRLVQNWFWDDKKKRLSVWLEAVAPMKQEEDEEGNFWYDRKLFYQRNDD